MSTFPFGSPRVGPRYKRNKPRQTDTSYPVSLKSAADKSNVGEEKENVIGFSSLEPPKQSSLVLSIPSPKLDLSPVISVQAPHKSAIPSRPTPVFSTPLASKTNISSALPAFSSVEISAARDQSSKQQDAAKDDDPFGFSRVNRKLRSKILENIEKKGTTNLGKGRDVLLPLVSKVKPEMQVCVMNHPIQESEVHKQRDDTTNSNMPSLPQTELHQPLPAMSDSFMQPSSPTSQTSSVHSSESDYSTFLPFSYKLEPIEEASKGSTRRTPAQRRRERRMISYLESGTLNLRAKNKSMKPHIDGDNDNMGTKRKCLVKHTTKPSKLRRKRGRTDDLAKAESDGTSDNESVVSAYHEDNDARMKLRSATRGAKCRGRGRGKGRSFKGDHAKRRNNRGMTRNNGSSVERKKQTLEQEEHINHSIQSTVKADREKYDVEVR